MVNHYSQSTRPNTKIIIITLNDVWVDLGPTEKVADLTYVALTRVRKISNLVIEPMSYDRLKCVKKTSNYKYRLLEGSVSRLEQKTQKS